ncbi:hypothetical protein ACFY93_08985 [Streptomyces sp. NPDC008313]|uniref:hypothetical protein n=1 Tax=Streptomyces sp. NPDC008313 TaxID=3364826 RepID=UPI0036E75317
MSTRTPVREAPPEPRSRRTAASRAFAPHPLRVEAVRGFAPWAGLALLAALAWPLAATADQWQGSWGETTSRLSGAAGLVGVPFALAAGAWQGGRDRRLRMTELRASAARTPLVQVLTAALPLAGWLAAAYALAAAGALIACAPYASAGTPALTVFAGGALTLGASALLGHAAGRVASWRLTAPALAVCGYVVLGLGNVSRSGLRALVPSSLRLVGDHRLPVWWFPLMSALWVCALAAAAVLAVAASRRSTALLPAAAAVGAALLLVHTGDGALRDNPLAHRQVCDDSTAPRVCVNATTPGLLPEVTAALAPLIGRLEGVDNLPVRFEDARRRPREDEAELPMLTPFGWSVVRGKLTDPSQYAWEAAQMLVRPDCEKSPSAQRVRVTDEAVLRWLAPLPSRDHMRETARKTGDKEALALYKAENKAYARLSAMSGDERRDWLGRYFATGEVCDPGPGEVPSL